MVTRRARRPKPTPALRFNRIVQIQSFVVSRDAFGSMIEAWTEVAEVWASVNQTGTSKTFKNESNRFLSLRSAQMTIRWRTGLDETMRVIYDGLIWNIVGIAEIGRRAGLKLFCQTDVDRPI